MAVCAVRANAQATQIFRTIPPLGGCKAEKPNGSRVYAAVHPYYSYTVGRSEELMRFPQEMPLEERNARLDRQARMMRSVWEGLIAKAPEDGFFIMVSCNYGHLAEEQKLLSFAKHRFGRDRVMYIGMASYAEREVAEFGGRMPKGDRSLLVFGEYTSRCVVDFAAKLLVALRMGAEEVFVLRRMSVDSDTVDLGDPYSPPERERIELSPPDERSRIFQRAKDAFEERFVERSKDALFGPFSNR